MITGFDPFGTEKVNPSWRAVSNIPDKIESVEIIKQQLPTVFDKSLEKLISQIEDKDPDAIILTGQAGGRHAISVERVAINVNDANIPDNENNKPKDNYIFDHGPTAFFSTLPYKEIVDQIRNYEQIPAEVSNSAGTFVCNHVMYGMLYHLHQRNKPIKGGFIHVPFLPEQVLNKPGKPYMALDDIVKGLLRAIKVTCEV